ncbi:hypothetical protein [Streptomyces sp. NPDC052610]|uniref:hypothetical protein n=1 Tax=Streptomyces sp. NPDC052610 TaxID=3154952 RepID=UPI0034490193
MSRRRPGSTTWRVRRLRGAGVLAGVFGVLAVPTAVVMLTVGVPQRASDERAFLSARPCGAETKGPAEECLRTAWFTVEAVRVWQRRSPGGWVRVIADDGRGDRADFDGTGRFLQRARPGDRVVGTVWRGEIVTLSAHGAYHHTTGHPVGAPVAVACGALVLLVSGGLGAYASWWWLRRTDRCAVRTAGLSAIALTVLGLGIYTIFLLPVFEGRAGPRPRARV